MKKFYLRSMAVACAFGLAACGGGNANLVLSISPIYGVTQDGMTISNNGGTPIAIPAGTHSYVFTENIGTDTAYDIKVVTPPSNATCSVINGKGTTGAYSPTGIAINCVANPYNVTAAVTGLQPDSTLVVVNGALSYNITNSALVHGVYSFTKYAADGTTVIGGQVGDGDAYGFVILTQPTILVSGTPTLNGQTCTLLNGGGIMHNGDVTNLTITCN